MKCRQVESQLPDYLGRQLALSVMAEVRDHLAGCPHCSAELVSLQKLLALAALDATPAMPIGEDEFLRGVRRRISELRIESHKPQTTSYKPFVRLVPFLAAAAVLVVVGVLVRSQKSEIRNQNTGSDYASVLTEPENPDLLDLAGSESELIQDLDADSVAAIQSELADNADVDELVEELTPGQQEQLVMELTRLYGGPKVQSSGG
jgi:hypothetical protein